ncbi:MAG: 30S ribosomal protein S24e [Candidatus Bathyarchaeia archaeon]
MKIKICSEKHNPLLKRKEITFQVEHENTGKTPQRLEIKKMVAAELKVDEKLVFVKKFETKTGTQTAIGEANVYDTFEQAVLIEPEYIIERNMPQEKAKEAEEQKPEIKKESS